MTTSITHTDNGPIEDSSKLDLTDKKILIIEDSKPNLELLRFSLTKKKFNVISATTGKEGLEKTNSDSPDLILLDIALPDISGIDVCKTIKDTPENASIPIIFITGHGDSQTLIKGFEAGAADYIIKPLKLPEVLARIQTHLKINHLIAIEKQYNVALKNANEEINKLLGVATHDLRNPLVSIRGLAEFLKETEITDDQKELIDTIHDASETLLFLVENLLDYASVDAGVIDLECKDVNVEELLTKTLKLHNITASKKNITLKLDNQSYKEAIYIDDRRITQLVDNLITNAIKFSPFDTTVTIVLEQDAENTMIKVQDQGQGIPEDEMNKLFKSFGKTSVRPTNNEQSTGLGLVICRKIAESHQGSISVSNIPGAGAEFKITLKNKDGATRMTPKSALVVDDEAHIRLFVKMILKDIGIEDIREAKNGIEALEAYKNARPDVMLMDVNMAGMGGVETLEKLKEIDDNPCVIMLTSTATREVVERCVAAGARNYIRKDTPKEEIKVILQETFSQL